MDTSTAGRLIPRSILPYASVASQLEMMFQTPDFEKQCAKWKDLPRTAGIFHDIYDGAVWRENESFLGFDDGASNLGFCLNIDWFCPFKSSTASLGVVLLCNYNLPREVRYKRENVILVAVLPKMGSTKSKLMNQILKPFVNEMKQLYEEGVNIKTPSRTRHGRLVKVMLLCVACDTPAARAVCGFPGIRAYMGCTRCKKRFKIIRPDAEPAEPDESQDPDSDSYQSDLEAGLSGAEEVESESDSESESKRASASTSASAPVPVPVTGVRRSRPMHTWDYGGFDPCEPRTDGEQRSQAQIWLGTQSNSGRNTLVKENGVRWTVLMRLTYYDSIKFCVVDPMHCIFLCNARHIVDTWIKTKKLDNVKLGQRLASIQLPPGTNRRFTDFGKAKILGTMRAADWKCFILITSGAVLHDLLPPADLAMWLAFRQAVFLLCNHSLTTQCLSDIETYLETYLTMFEEIYGSGKISPSQHFITHITECIRDYGPSHVFWLFAFERVNGLLTRVKTNNKLIAGTLMKAMRDYQYMHRARRLIGFNDRHTSAFDEIEGNCFDETPSTLCDRLNRVHIIAYADKLTGSEKIPYTVLGLVKERVCMSQRTYAAVQTYLESVYAHLPTPITVHRIAHLVPRRLIYFSEQLADNKWGKGNSSYVCAQLAGAIVPFCIEEILIVGVMGCTDASQAVTEHILLQVQGFELFDASSSSSSSRRRSSSSSSSSSSSTSSTQPMMRDIRHQLIDLPSSRVWQKTNSGCAKIVIPLSCVICKFAPYWYHAQVSRTRVAQCGQVRRPGATEMVEQLVMRVCPVVTQQA
jgi:hypothetical protein